MSVGSGPHGLGSAFQKSRVGLLEPLPTSNTVQVQLHYTSCKCTGTVLWCTSQQAGKIY